MGKFSKTISFSLVFRIGSWEWSERSESSLDDDVPDEFHGEHVNELYSMIQRARTSSVLHQLETYRKNLTESQFRSLLLSLTEKLNDPSISSNSRSDPVRQENRTIIIYVRPSALDQLQINRCVLLVLCNIVAVIKKHQIRSVETLWKQILSNDVGRTAQVNPKLKSFERSLSIVFLVLSIFTQRKGRYSI